VSKKILTVCGDSWFSTDSNYSSSSFSEILASKNNLQLENLARGGCSNFAISLQVNKAIELNSDFIIVGCTSCDRIELPLTNNSDIIKKFFNFDWFKSKEWKTTAKEFGTYYKPIGLLNVKNSHATQELSSQYSNSQCETIISESLNNLIWQNRYDLDEETIVALKQYISHIYDNNIKQQIDCWVMSDAARRLISSGIPFLMYVEPLFNGEFISDIEWLDNHHKVMYNDFSFNDYPIGDPIFHLNFNESLDFANKWESRLRTEGFL
jgi:hypothetical protein